MEYQIIKTLDVFKQDNILIKNYPEENLILLKEKISNLEKRIDFVNKHSINLDNNTNSNILLMVSKIDNIIDLINKNVISKAQINKNIHCEYDF